MLLFGFFLIFISLFYLASPDAISGTNHNVDVLKSLIPHAVPRYSSRRGDRGGGGGGGGGRSGGGRQGNGTPDDQGTNGDPRKWSDDQESDNNWSASGLLNEDGTNCESGRGGEGRDGRRADGELGTGGRGLGCSGDGQRGRAPGRNCGKNSASAQIPPNSNAPGCMGSPGSCSEGTPTRFIPSGESTSVETSSGRTPPGGLPVQPLSGPGGESMGAQRSVGPSTRPSPTGMFGGQTPSDIPAPPGKFSGRLPSGKNPIGGGDNDATSEDPSRSSVKTPTFQP